MLVAALVAKYSDHFLFLSQVSTPGVFGYNGGNQNFTDAFLIPTMTDNPNDESLFHR